MVPKALDCVASGLPHIHHNLTQLSTSLSRSTLDSFEQLNQFWQMQFMPDSIQTQKQHTNLEVKFGSQKSTIQNA